MINANYPPGSKASFSGTYEELNVFGTPTGRVVLADKDETLPSAPRGFGWRPIAELSVAELRARAAEYRKTAATATTEAVRDALHRIAQRFDATADEREQRD
jgi:hypothetical protein